MNGGAAATSAGQPRLKWGKKLNSRDLRMLQKTPKHFTYNGTHKSASKQGRKCVNKWRTQAPGTPLPRAAPTITAGRLVAGRRGPESTSEVTRLLNLNDRRLGFAAPSPLYKIILRISPWKAPNGPLSGGTWARTTTPQDNSPWSQYVTTLLASRPSHGAFPW